MRIVAEYAYQSWTGAQYVAFAADGRLGTLSRAEAEALARDITAALAELDAELSPSARGELRTGDDAEGEYQP